MITSRIIPCLDVKDGRVVKGVKFENLRDSGCPVELSRRYQKENADEIVVLDISATNEKRQTQLETVREIRDSISIPLTCGGGIKSIEDISKLLNAGADKVSINSAAVNNPNLINQASIKFGSQCVVIAIDTKRISEDKWSVLINAGKVETQLNCIDWVKTCEKLGAGEILLTSFDRDGTGLGYDIDLLRKIKEKINIPIIASGGAKTPKDLFRGLENGADAVLAASMFHFENYSIPETKKILLDMGANVRIC